MWDQAQVATNGVLVYAAMILGALFIIMTNFEKIGGVFYKIAERRRVAAAARQGADITIMKRQIEYLTQREHSMTTELREARDDLRAARVELVDFYEWAYQIQKVAARTGMELPNPPHEKE